MQVLQKDGLLMRMSEQDFDMVLNINLKGSFNMARHVINYMIKNVQELLLIFLLL